MDEQNIKLYFGIAERAVKLLLNSYFKLFREDNLLNIAPKLKVSTRKIPHDYISLGNTIKLAVPQNHINFSSLLFIPENCLELPLDAETTVYPDLVDKNYKIPLPSIETTLLTKNLSNIASMILFVYTFYKKSHPELQKINLELSNNAIKLRDANFPYYEHDSYIGFKFNSVANLNETNTNNDIEIIKA